MRKIETVSCIGFGAMGCAYLSKIAETLPKEKIRVIAGGSRVERYRQEGVTVNGKKLGVTFCAPEDPVAPADLLIFAVKYPQLAQAVEDARGHVGPDTVVISFLNGVNSEEIIGAAYGMDKVLYCMCRVSATRVGRDVFCSDIGTICFGEARNVPGAYTRRVLQVEEFLRQVSLPYIIPEDMIRALWVKLTFNVGFNQVSAVLRGDYSILQQVKSARSLAMAAMKEVAAVAEKEGIQITPADLEDGFAGVDRMAPDGKTSMLQDVEAGLKTEVAIFGGIIVELGKKHGVPVPVNEVLVCLLLALDEACK